MRKKKRVRRSICWLLLSSREVVLTLITTEGEASSLTMIRKKVDYDRKLGSLCFKIIHSYFYFYFYGGVCWTRRSTMWHYVFFLLSVAVDVTKMGEIRFLGFVDGWKVVFE
jgi:hypothetical protein